MQNKTKQDLVNTCYMAHVTVSICDNGARRDLADFAAWSQDSSIDYFTDNSLSLFDPTCTS